ncbi:ETX/MTX2 family pore-forming toxin [Microbacterium sp. SLBN-146]|uniref:ETX/MTX2 family pore-forming toxin n=1 Tax=Microbacterium sp. SLBN-146 TaxID=2768457 RepID=UPI001C93174D|nr:ETX/MTX2 family pore-forming toxin [Microbacterium sp. SLBN-146]
MGVYDLWVKPDNGVFDAIGKTGTLTFKNVKSTTPYTWKANDWNKFTVTLPPGLVFQAGAERTAALCDGGPFRMECSMSSDRRVLTAKATNGGGTQTLQIAPHLTALRVVVAGPVEGNATVSFDKHAYSGTAPCATAPVPAGTATTFDIASVMTSGNPGLRIDTRDIKLSLDSFTSANTRVSAINELILYESTKLKNFSKTQTQTLTTPSFSQTLLSAYTLTNTHSVTSGVEVSASAKAGIVFANFETTSKLSFNYQFGNQQSWTTSEARAVNISAQNITLPPGYVGFVKATAFSAKLESDVTAYGEFEGSVRVANCDGSNARTMSVASLLANAKKSLPSWVSADGTVKTTQHVKANGFFESEVENLDRPMTAAELKSQTLSPTIAFPVSKRSTKPLG